MYFPQHNVETPDSLLLPLDVFLLLCPLLLVSQTEWPSIQ